MNLNKFNKHNSAITNTLLKDKHRKVINLLTYILLSGHFYLNFIGSPILKWLYLIEVIYFIFLALFFSLEDLIIPIFAFLFIEGQGRILFSYNPFFRIVFDLTVGLCAIKMFIKEKNIFPTGILPNIILLSIFFHFLWFIVQQFNINSVGVLGTIASSKIYIYPFFIFFMFLHFFNKYSSEFKWNEFYLFLVFLIICETILSFHQMQEKEGLMLSIHPYYSRSMRDVFKGVMFRPYGTSANPGALSTYLYLSVGLLFIREVKIRFSAFINIICIGLITVSLLFQQVRTSMVQFLLIVVVAQAGLLFASEKKIKRLVSLLIISSITVFIVISTYEKTIKVLPNISTDVVLARIAPFFEEGGLNPGKYRDSTDIVVDSVISKLIERPLGIGPGSTGAAAVLSTEYIKNNPFYRAQQFESYENFHMNMAKEFGFGMIFYVFVIMAIPIMLFYYFLKTQKIFARSDIILISFAVTSVTLLASYGAVNIPYNPVSFYFWFYCAFGICRYNEYLKEKSIDH